MATKRVRRSRATVCTLVPCDIAKLSKAALHWERACSADRRDINACLRAPPATRPRVRRVCGTTRPPSPAWLDPRHRVPAALSPQQLFPAPAQTQPAYSAQQPPPALSSKGRRWGTRVERAAPERRSQAHLPTSSRPSSMHLISLVRHPTPRGCWAGWEGTRVRVSGTARSPRPVLRAWCPPAPPQTPAWIDRADSDIRVLHDRPEVTQAPA